MQDKPLQRLYSHDRLVLEARTIKVGPDSITIPIPQSMHLVHPDARVKF
jgi:hypothetical protein